jgi:P27 family predicted phage terminase small subunit
MAAPLDRAALAAYCQAYGRWVEAEEKVREFGAVIKAPSGFPIQSPYLGIANTAMRQMRDFLTEFGMTPASRTRIEISGKPSDSPGTRWAGTLS